MIINIMIIASLGSELRLITQNDHAAWAYELLKLWRADALPENPRRESILLAAREHDNGWLEADSAPHRTPSGRPHSFLTLPLELRLEIWRRGLERLSDGGDSPTHCYAAALVVHHALELHQGLRSDKASAAPTAASEIAPWVEALEDWGQQRDAWLVKAGIDDINLLESDYGLLRLVDTLSLAVCADWPEPGVVGGGDQEQRRFVVKKDTPRSDTMTLHLEPFPLAGATTFEIACRHIDDLAHPSGVDLAMALASARWRRLRVRVAP